MTDNNSGATTFENARIGDRVWSIVSGWGYVGEIKTGSIYPIEVTLDCGDTLSYTFGGRSSVNHEFQSLFWNVVCFAVPTQPIRTMKIFGKDVPDLRFVPRGGMAYYYPCLQKDEMFGTDIFYAGSVMGESNIKNNLCYPCTGEGKEAAMLHARAMVELIKE